VAVRISGNSIEITAVKSQSEHETWSELIHFDTRGSRVANSKGLRFSEAAQEA